ncbi:MAG: bifunctional metallophosphatase/5'-nucleotidase [Cytophagales bacterium]|nr:MAG: bifunctional metallophosphatase/5'-nucleotidase [Cytophagales bacterium]
MNYTSKYRYSKYAFIFFLFLSSQLFLSLSIFGQQTQEFTILQINDVYEIAPLSNGTVGGMARVATVYKQLKAENPNTFFVHAGDFVNPSVIGTLSVDGKRIRGKQMIEVMNTAGVEYVTLGNHEFDLEYADLQERINESTFTWVIANAKHQWNNQLSLFFKQVNDKKTFFPSSVVLKAGKLRIGLIGLMLPVDVGFLEVENPLEVVQTEYNRLKDSTEVVLALTHQTIEVDKILAAKMQMIPLIMGGHEHDNMKVKVGESVICKADANAKTAYIHRFSYDFQTKKLTVRSEIKTIDNTIPDDPKTAEVVDKWLKIAENSARAIGLNPQAVVMETKEPLNGLESSVRSKTTNLTTFIAQAMREVSKNAVASFFNGGSIRIDDQIEGKVTEYDILRILPFGGQIFEVEMKGSLLLQVLEAGMKNRGKGGFLHHANIRLKGKNWKIGNKKIKKDKYYTIATTDFLMTGKEMGLGFLTEQNPDVRQVIKPDKNEKADLRNDIRRAIVSYLKNK